MNHTIRSIFLFAFLVLSLTACQSEATTSETESIRASAMIQNAEITVYKSPTCGCCKDWVTYLEEEGFNVTAVDHDDVDSIKVKYGLPDPKLKSCHTAIVDGYLVEGHVPASDIERLLSTKCTRYANDVTGYGQSHTQRLRSVVLHRIR